MSKRKILSITDKIALFKEMKNRVPKKDIVEKFEQDKLSIDKYPHKLRMIINNNNNEVDK